MKTGKLLMIKTYMENKTLRLVMMFFLLVVWLSVLSGSDSLVSPYAFCALAGILAYYVNIKSGFKMPENGRFFVILFSAAFSLAVVAANYSLVFPLNIKSTLLAAILLIAGYLIARNSLICVLNLRAAPKPERVVFAGKRSGAWSVFLISFILIAAVDILCLLFYCRPAALTPDSFWQIGKALHKLPYSNHHPFYHTMIIRGCLELGMALFNDINSAVAVYSFVQIMCMAGIFAFVIMTLYQAGISKSWLIISVFAYCLLPYHMIYSVTMWKDVLFGGVVLLFICALYREIRKIGSAGLNTAVLIIGSAGFCLLRSNGWTAFLMSFIVFAAALGRDYKKSLIIIIAVLAVTFGMKHPLLRVLEVSQPDTAEFLSIPEQQIARLLVEKADIPEEDLEQIEKVMDVERVREEYRSYISDPVKAIVRETGIQYLDENKPDFLKLWLKLGFRYPGIYLMAWIDQTKGYWNGGYNTVVVYTGIMGDEYGIKSTVHYNIVSEVLDRWIGLLSARSTELFRSIGFHVWISSFAMLVTMLEKRKEWVIFVPLIAIILTLLISTPVSSEFRYAYSVFTAFPFVMFVAFADKGSAKDNCSS